jgi:hypothetical protein
MNAAAVINTRLVGCGTRSMAQLAEFEGPEEGSGMTLVVVTVAVVGLLIATLAIYLFMIGAALNRTAGNLSDCAQNVRTIADQAQAIGPAVERLNATGADLLAAMPLLVDDAEGVAPKLVPFPAAPATSAPGGPTSSPAAVQTGGAAATPDALQVGGGLLDAPVGVGYLDV